MVFFNKIERLPYSLFFAVDSHFIDGLTVDRSFAFVLQTLHVRFIVGQKRVTLVSGICIDGFQQEHGIILPFGRAMPKEVTCFLADDGTLVVHSYMYNGIDFSAFIFVEVQLETVHRLIVFGYRNFNEVGEILPHAGIPQAVLFLGKVGVEAQQLVFVPVTLFQSSVSVVVHNTVRCSESFPVDRVVLAVEIYYIQVPDAAEVPQLVCDGSDGFGFGFIEVVIELIHILS